MFNTSIPGGLVPGILSPNGWTLQSFVNADVVVTGLSGLFSVGLVDPIGTGVISISGCIVNSYLGDVIVTSTDVIAVSGVNAGTVLSNVIITGDANIGINSQSVVSHLGTVTVSVNVISVAKIIDSGGTISDLHQSRVSPQVKKIVQYNYDVYIEGFSGQFNVGDVNILVSSKVNVKKIPIPVKLIKTPIGLQQQPVILNNATVHLARQPIKLIRQPVDIIESCNTLKHKPINLIKQKITLAVN